MTPDEDKKVVSLPLKSVWGKNETAGSESWRQKQAGRARRHSRLVFLLRLVLPSVAAVLIGLVLSWPQLQAQKEGFSFADVSLENVAFPDDQIMENPRLFVVDKDERPLNVVAVSAQEFPSKNGRKVLFKQLKADMMLESGVWLDLDSETALYSQAENELELQKKVNLYSDKGYELETTHAVVDIDAKTIVGKEKTTGQGPSGDVVADGFSVSDGGKVLTFTGHVRMVVYPEKEK